MLTYTTQFMQERIDFLTANGMPLEDIAKAAVAHPQVSPTDWILSVAAATGSRSAAVILLSSLDYCMWTERGKGRTVRDMHALGWPAGVALQCR